MEFNNYKFRCSSLGKIVSKSGKLTDTSKSYLKQLFVEHIYKVRKEISSKYFEKGTFEEESGITLLKNALYPKGFIGKNTELKSNEFIVGTADCIYDNKVFDIKNAWDVFTFSNADLTHDYEWQLVGYMMLWNLDKASLFYCLNNTPEHLLVAEERQIFYKNNFISFEDENYLRLCDEMRVKHNYDHLPLEERFKIWDIDFSEEKKEKLIESVKVARNYLNELWIERENHLNKNRELIGFIPTLSIHEPTYKVVEEVPGLFEQMGGEMNPVAELDNLISTTFLKS